MKQRHKQNKSEFGLDRMIEPDIAERMAQDRDQRLADAAVPENVREIYRRFGEGWKTLSHEIQETLVAATTQRIGELAENPSSLELLAWLELAKVVQQLQVWDRNRRRHARHQQGRVEKSRDAGSSPSQARGSSESNTSRMQNDLD